MQKINHLKLIRDFLYSDTREAKIATVFLSVVAVASLPILVVGVGAIGNAVQVFKMFKVSSRYNKRQIQSTAESLKRQKMIEYVRDKNGKTIVFITQKGERRLRAFSIECMKIKKPKKWDGKWRLVMYDLPIRYKKGRNALRFHLKDLGFYQFQKSAWIYPYKCEEEISFIADFFGMTKHVEILTVDNLFNESKLKKHFKIN